MKFPPITFKHLRNKQTEKSKNKKREISIALICATGLAYNCNIASVYVYIYSLMIRMCVVTKHSFCMNISVYLPAL